MRRSYPYRKRFVLIRSIRGLKKDSWFKETKQGRSLRASALKRLNLDEIYLFLFMTICASTLAPFVIRHLFLTPFLDCTHSISKFSKGGQCT